MVTKPDSIFSFPGQPSTSCGELQFAGETGVLDEQACQNLPALIATTCECSPISSPSTSPLSVLPISNPTSPPTLSDQQSSCQATSSSSCVICGEGKRVGNRDATFAFPNQSPVKCGVLEDVGIQGTIITGEHCVFLPPLVANICECEPCDVDVNEITSVPTASPVNEPATSVPVGDISACQTNLEIGCPVCGEGKRVGDRDAWFVYPNQQPIRCGVLEDIGVQNILLTEYQCSVLPDLVADVCKCEVCNDDSITTAPTSSPTANDFITTTPVYIIPDVAGDICPIIPENGCSVCGEGKRVTKKESIFSFPGYPIASCEVLEAEGLVGRITEGECEFLPDLVADVCGCEKCEIITIPDNTDVCKSNFETEGCSVCGKGKRVGAPDAIFAFPTYPELTCSMLEAVGVTGELGAFECGVLPGLIEVCECKVCDDEENTFAPTTPLTPAPVVTFPDGFDRLICPIVPENGCSICGKGKRVTNVETEFSFPGQPTVQCVALESAGLEGIIPLEQCSYLPNLVADDCGCEECEIISVPDDIDVCTSDFVNEGCSVCGEGKQVGDPDAIFAFPNFPEVTCGMLENIGAIGELGEFECGVLPGLIEVCNCKLCGDENNEDPEEFTPMPTPPPSTFSPTNEIRTAAPSVDTLPDGIGDKFICPIIPDNGCSICGEGKRVTNKGGVFAFPDQPSVGCVALEAAGLEGIIPLDECPYLPSLVVHDCGCEPCEIITIPDDTNVCTSGFDVVGCSICGEGKHVGAPEAIFAFGSYPELPCGMFEGIGVTGELAPLECAVLPQLIDVCQCQSCSDEPNDITNAPITQPVTPSPIAPSPVSPAPITPSPVIPSPVTPVPTPITPAPVTPSPITPDLVTPQSLAPVSYLSPCPDVKCSVCGEGKTVSSEKFFFFFSLPGQPDSYCGYEQFLGQNLKTCEFSASLKEICGCQDCYIKTNEESISTAPPTLVSSFSPSSVPTPTPSAEHSAIPTLTPSSEPSSDPTVVPSVVPTTNPTYSPSLIPTTPPSVVPTTAPSSLPTSSPSMAPTTAPSSAPSEIPTAAPSVSPSSTPSGSPSSGPTANPSLVPSTTPTHLPTPNPTLNPIMQYDTVFHNGKKGIGKSSNEKKKQKEKENKRQRRALRKL